MSDSSQPHELQHTRPPCPSPAPGVHSDSRPSSQWCHPAISSSVVPFSSCLQSLPTSESFPMSQLLLWGGQSTGLAASASFPTKKSQGWSPSEWTSQRNLDPNPWRLWMLLFMAEETLEVWLRFLWCRDYPEFSKWALNIITSVLMGVEQREIWQQKRRKCDDGNKILELSYSRKESSKGMQAASRS